MMRLFYHLKKIRNKRLIFERSTGENLKLGTVVVQTKARKSVQQLCQVLDFLFINMRLRNISIIG